MADKGDTLFGILIGALIIGVAVFVVFMVMDIARMGARTELRKKAYKSGAGKYALNEATGKIEFRWKDENAPSPEKSE